MCLVAFRRSGARQTPVPNLWLPFLLLDDDSFQDPLMEWCAEGGEREHAEIALLVCALPGGSRY